MQKKTTLIALLPILFGFFVMGFCDIVGFTSDYVQRSFGWCLYGFCSSVFLWVI